MSDPAMTIDDLRAEVARLQDLADARLYRARAARITLESVGCPRSEPVDVGAARAAGMIEDLRAEVDRLTAALADAQPVVEWREDVGFSHARIGRFWMVVRRDGWRLELSQPFSSTPDLVEGGPETGPAGKAACEAAYRRAVGLPPRTVCPPVATAILTSTL